MVTVNESLNDLQTQYEEETDPARKEQIKNEYLRAIDRVEAIAQGNIEKFTGEYEAAVAALQKANAELEKAREDLADFADAIKKVAKAIDMLAKIAAKVA